MKPRKEVEKIVHSKRSEEPRMFKVRLDLNENSVGCPPKVLEMLRMLGPFDSEYLSCYPEYGSLEEKIAEYHHVSPENILLTNGAHEALHCIIDTYVEEGDKVIVPSPASSFLDKLITLRRGVIEPVLYHKDFSFPLPELLHALKDNPRMVITVSPHNFMGTSIEENDLKTLLSKNTIVLLDETYSDFTGVSHVKLVEDFPNLFVVRSFSKSYGLAGLRLGYIASDSENIKNLEKVKLPFSVNTIADMAGYTALDGTYLEEVVEKMRQEREFFCKELLNLGVKAYPTDANFVLIDFGEECNKIWQALQDEDVLVKNLNNYPLLKGYVRVTVGSRDDNEILMEVLRETLPPEAILFGLGGVFVDEGESYPVAAKKAAEFFSSTCVDFESGWDIAERIIHFTEEKVSQEEVMKKFQSLLMGDNFDGIIKNEKPIFDTNFLEELRKDYKLGIVTSRPKEVALYTLERFNLRKYFDTVITRDDVCGKYKPEPHGIRLAIKNLQVNRAVFVGNTYVDMLAAESAKAVPIAIVSPGNEEMVEVFEEMEIERVVKSVNDIRKVLW